jgi:hypothetical protein
MQSHIKSFGTYFWLSAWALVLFIFFDQAWQGFQAQGLDFAIYYSVGETILAGRPEAIYNSSEQAPWISYAPLVTPTFYYFALAPFKYSKIAFFALKPLAYATWPFLLAALTSKSKVSPKALIAAIIACIALCPTVYEETIVGNINVFLLTALFSSFVLAQRGRIFIAATIVTAIAVCKPQYSLFWIPIFLLRPWPAIAGGFTGLGVLLAHTLFFLSPSQLVSMTKRWFPLITNPIAGVNDVNNMSTSGVLERLLTPMKLIMSADLQGVNLLSINGDAASLVAKISVVIFSLLAATIVLPALKSKNRDGDSLAVWVAAITLMTLFITPVIWLTHYMLMVVPVFVSLYRLLGSRQFKLAGALAIGVFYAIYSAGQFINPSESLRVHARAYGWPFGSLLVVLLVLVVAQILKINRASQEPQHES